MVPGMSPLTPGSTARIYRAAGDLAAPAFNVPVEGRVELRNLQPGQYRAVDECGGEVAFEVTHATEVVRLGKRGRSTGAAAAADSTRQEPDREVPAAPEPTHPRAQDPADVELEDLSPESRVTLPASEDYEQAGSALEQPHPVVAGGSDGAAELTVAQLRDALRERGDKVSGKREELIARLERRDGSA